MISQREKNTLLPINPKITARADQKNEGTQDLPAYQFYRKSTAIISWCQPQDHQSYREEGHAPQALLAQAHNSTLR